MNIIKSSKLCNGYTLSIVEADNVQAVEHFINRYQLVLDTGNSKRLMPKNKLKFLNFNDDDILYTLVSDKTNEDIVVNTVLYHELILCDRDYFDCEVDLELLSILTSTVNLYEELINIFNLTNINN